MSVHAAIKKKLIVSADDFGLTERINQAILLAHRTGIVTSASLMANGEAFESAAAMARANPGLDAGLHLNLTEGHPVCDASIIPTLASRRGFLYDHPIKLWFALWRGKVRRPDVETESRAQLEKALGAGVEITHIDGHKHVHAMPPVLDAVLHIAAGCGIKAVRSLVESTPGLLSLIARNKAARTQVLKQYLSGVVISMAFRASMRGRPPGGVVTPLRFYGLTQTGFLDLDAFADIVRSLSPGVSEIMCHPGYVDAALEQTPTRLRSQRERELRLLTGGEVRGLIGRANVELICYRDLVRDYGSCDGHPILDRCSAL